MRSLVSAVSAAITAVIIGLLIASVASSARAAEISHAKAARLAEVQAAANTGDTQMALDAYHERLTQAYQQLAIAYAALQQRDAQYRALADQANGNAKDLAAANAALDAKLVAAYRLLQQYSAAMRGPSAPAAAQPAPPVNVAPGAAAPANQPAATTPRPSAAPAATPAPQPTQTMYCHNDAEGHYHCEDHPW